MKSQCELKSANKGEGYGERYTGFKNQTNKEDVQLLNQKSDLDNFLLLEV